MLRFGHASLDESVALLVPFFMCWRTDIRLLDVYVKVVKLFDQLGYPCSSLLSV